MEEALRRKAVLTLGGPVKLPELPAKGKIKDNCRKQSHPSGPAHGSRQDSQTQQRGSCDDDIAGHIGQTALEQRPVSGYDVSEPCRQTHRKEPAVRPGIVKTSCHGEPGMS